MDNAREELEKLKEIVEHLNVVWGKEDMGEANPWMMIDFVDENMRLERLIADEIRALKDIVDPPPPPPDAVHASNFGRAGAGLVEDSIKNWARGRLAALQRKCRHGGIIAPAEKTDDKEITCIICGDAECDLEVECRPTYRNGSHRGQIKWMGLHERCAKASNWRT